MLDSREYFENSKINIKLIRRWWRALYAYDKRTDFRVVLSTYFNGKSKGKIESHLKISDKVK